MCSFGACAVVFLLEPLTVRVRHQAIIRRLQREVLAEQFDQQGGK
jgi:heme exporter protein D